MIDLKTATTLTRKYLGATITVLLVLSGVMGYVFWNGYKDLDNARNQLEGERKSLDDEKYNFEKDRTASAITLAEQKAELGKREFILKQHEAQNTEREAELRQRASEYNAAFEKLQQEQSTVSQAQRQKESEDKIQALMSQFSNMGVDLNAPPSCDDIEGQSKFNKARAIFTEIYTLANANGLTRRYVDFFSQNEQINVLICK